MATFVLICRDKPGGLELRLATRDTHLAYLDSAALDALRAGPILDEAGSPIGSILIVEAPDLAAAQAFSDADPYAKAGLFDHVEILPWRQTIGAP